MSRWASEAAVARHLVPTARQHLAAGDDRGALRYLLAAVERNGVTAEGDQVGV